MIDICKLNNREAGAEAEFHCVSLFDFDIKAASYDIVSAQGFIEYISLVELDTVLGLISKGLKSGGAIALGSRNRLFNLHSLNEFSLLEMQLNTVNKLLHESIILQSSKSQSEAIAMLAGLNYEYSHPDLHPETGIKVERRFQFSPSDLIGRLTKHGLSPTRVFPVHFHGLPLSLAKDGELNPLHAELADMVSKQYINSHALFLIPLHLLSKQRRSKDEQTNNRYVSLRSRLTDICFPENKKVLTFHRSSGKWIFLQAKYSFISMGGFDGMY